MKKTLTDWLNTLPPDIRNKAINNVYGLNTMPNVILHTMHGSLLDALEKAFMAEYTPEGVEYWDEVKDRFRLT